MRNTSQDYVCGCILIRGLLWAGIHLNIVVHTCIANVSIMLTTLISLKCLSRCLLQIRLRNTNEESNSLRGVYAIDSEQCQATTSVWSGKKLTPIQGN